MKYLILSGVLIVVVAALPARAAVRRQALVIGNDSYPGNALKNARNDAQAIATALGSLGYVVMLQLDTTHKVLQDSIDIFSAGLNPGDTAVLYYSGHGLQVDGENYLVPTDFNASSPLDVRTQASSLSSILDGFASHGASTQVVILDSCRDNPFLATRSLHGGWAGMGGSKGTFLAFGTAPGSTASDNPGEAHGLFTQALLKYLTSSQLDVEQVFERVREDVIRESHGLQIPWTASSLVGSLHFIPQLDSDSAAPQRTFTSVNSLRGRDTAYAASAETRSLLGIDPAPGSSSAANSAKILVDQGLLLAQQENYNEAVRSLSAALVADPRSSIALRVLGLIFHIIGRNTDAVAELNRAVDINPEDHLAYSYRCLVLVASDPASAVRDCEAALGLQPTFAPAHLGLANALFALGQSKEAYSQANATIQLRPNWSIAYAVRGKIDASLGKYSSAQQDYQTAIRLAAPEP